jgi:AcrR family transcriptional regulator/DNA-binding MarR family transcriptional regulator
MVMPTVTRAEALVPRIARIGAEPARREAVALGLVDSLLERDGETLRAALDGLRDARARAAGDQELAGWLDAAIAFAHWGLERVPSQTAVARGTQAYDFLRALQGSPAAGSSQLGSAELRDLLDTDETQVSRTGRRLLELGLVTRRKVGRQVFWQLTPRGQRALEEAPAPRRSSGSEFWQEALRRGFEAASGDEPGEPREVDPTRERIIRCTLALHTSQGIQATTRADVAAKAGVPLEMVEALFPTTDDLVRSCAQHFMESLQLPPRDHVPEVFAGASSEPERIHRLVETFFGAYERGAPGIVAGRRERNVAPAVEESVEELETTFDALVSEALRPARSDSSSVASLRALTDVEVWRVLRDQGATPGAAIDQASAAVERWLEAQTA